MKPPHVKYGICIRRWPWYVSIFYLGETKICLSLLRISKTWKKRNWRDQSRLNDRHHKRTTFVDMYMFLNYNSMSVINVRMQSNKHKSRHHFNTLFHYYWLVGSFIIRAIPLLNCWTNKTCALMLTVDKSAFLLLGALMASLDFKNIQVIRSTDY